MRDYRIGQWGESEPVLQGSLANIKQLIEMDLEPADVGWGPEPARLFSIDAAMLLFRGHADLMSDLERKAISRTLGEARRLAVDRGESELGWLQNELASHLDRSSARGVWLTALNALLPSPYRAAEAVVKAIIEVARSEAMEDLRELLRQRLRARLGEGLLLTEETGAAVAAV